MEGLKNIIMELLDMELKSSLQYYTKSELLNFVKKIWAVDVREEDHNKLVNHFDRIVGHPKGADLLFYQDEDSSGNIQSAESAVFAVKLWHSRNGKPAFKGEPVPSPAVRKPAARSSAQERALKSSSENLVKVQRIAADINSAGQAAAAALGHFDVLLGQLQAKQASGSEEKQLAELLRGVSSLESAQHNAVMAVRKLESLKLTVQFARDGAQRDLSSRFFDRGIQASILQQMTRSSDQYLAQLSVVTKRHGELHARATLLLDVAEQQLTRLFSITGTGPTKAANTFSALATAANVRPYLMSVERPSQSIESQFVELQKAIRSAVGEFTWQITSTSGEHPGTYAGVVQFIFNNLSDDQRFGLSVPLSELVQIEGRNWQSLAAANAEVDLPFRMCSGTVASTPGSRFRGLKEIKELTQVLLTPTNGSIVPSNVRVRAAVWNEPLAAFRFMTEGTAPTTLLWTPAATLQNSHGAPAVQTNKPNRIGFFHSPCVPLLGSFSMLANVQFDDYIVVFPTDSGLAPIYVMFKDRRDYPGVVSGSGQPVSVDWFNRALSQGGAPVPVQIAALLRGQVFKRFDLFTAAFWRAVAADPQLNPQLNDPSLEQMRNGTGPVVIYHKQAVSKGGGAYDMDNLSIGS